MCTYTCVIILKFNFSFNLGEPEILCQVRYFVILMPKCCHQLGKNLLSIYLSIYETETETETEKLSKSSPQFQNLTDSATLIQAKIQHSLFLIKINISN